MVGRMLGSRIPLCAGEAGVDLHPARKWGRPPYILLAHCYAADRSQLASERQAWPMAGRLRGFLCVWCQGRICSAPARCRFEGWLVGVWRSGHLIGRQSIFAFSPPRPHQPSSFRLV